MEKYLLIIIGMVSSLHGFSQVGKVGINTTAPAAMLHVKDSSVVFTGKISFPGGEGSMPVSGTGSRMLWHPGKAAFRAGYVNGTFWDKDSIGLLSIATGFNTTASGDYSLAFGRSSVARGFSSRSIGYKTRAIADHATAIGDSSFALGINSIAMGHHSLASASFSCAIGNQTTASALHSMAFGDATLASGANALAMGQGSIASGNGSTAFGKNTLASGPLSTALGGFTSAIGGSSIAIGLGTVANGSNSIAIGTNSVANGFASIVLGIESETTSDWGIAIGSNARATTDIATSIGWYTTASGPGALALGSNTLASGSVSVAMGSFTKASGVNALSCGTNTIAKPYGSFVLGRYNDSTTISTNNWNNLDALFIIGNGQDHETRSNAMTVLKNGNIGIGNDVSPNAHLHISKGVGGTIYNANSSLILEDNADQYIQFSNLNNGQSGIRSGNSDIDTRSAILFFADSSITFRAGGNTTRMSIENNGNVGIGTTSPGYLLEVNGSVGKPGGGSWSNSSDVRLKKNIHTYTDGLESILKINPVSYQYNELSGYDTEPEYVGVIAQELKEIAPYMVSVLNKETDDGSNDFLQVDNSAMTYMLINAVKEQQARIDILQSELDELKQQIHAKKQLAEE